MLNTISNRALLCALLIHTATHAFRIPFLQDFTDLSQSLTDSTTRSSISIEEIGASEDTSSNMLVIRATNIDLVSNEDAATPTATLDKSAQGTYHIIEVPVSGGLFRVIIENQQFVRTTLTRRVEQYRDHEGIVSSSVQQESISRSHVVRGLLQEDSYEINYNKTEQTLTISFRISTEDTPQESSERIPLNITIQE